MPKEKYFVLRKEKKKRKEEERVKAKEVGTLPSTVIQGRRDIDLPLGVFLLRRLGPET
jgi:hypothetical protein